MQKRVTRETRDVKIDGFRREEAILDKGAETERRTTRGTKVGSNRKKKHQQGQLCVNEREIKRKTKQEAKKRIFHSFLFFSDKKQKGYFIFM